MCSRDILFWWNTFLWTYDPRKTREDEYPVLPFITYPYQDEAILLTEASIGRDDLLIEKSRDMGATWILMMVPLWRFLFRDLQTFLCVSRKESLVDSTEDPDTLFWKIDFALNHMPGWLRPAVNRQKLHFCNLENKSTIDGESTTGDLARGGRRTAVFLDEFPTVQNGEEVLRATRDVTESRLFCGTPNGTGNAFYRLRQKGDIRLLRFHWTQHPAKSRGLYTARNGKLKIQDNAYRFPAEYPFILDGKDRSPWYDEQCRRAASDREIAQELDIDYQASACMFFKSDVLNRILKDDTREPPHVGEIDFVTDPVECKGFVPMDRGRLRLWCPLDARNEPDRNQEYVLGIDISAGGGGSMGSNSAITVGCKRTGEMAAEFVTPEMMPHDFAVYAVALAQYFGGAKMIWEANGYGQLFGKTVIQMGYRNFYYRRNESNLNREITKQPGWWSSIPTKLLLLGEYRRVLGSGEFVNRSEDSVKECWEYIQLPSNSVVHASSQNMDDAAGAGESHGDRVISAALCWYGMRGEQETRTEAVKMPPNCIAARYEELLRSERRPKLW